MLGCIYSERFVDESNVAAMRAIHKEMAEQLANELPARMICLHRVDAVIDVQFMVPCLTQFVNIQDDI